MTQPRAQEDAFGMLIRVEEGAGAFYRTCAAKFPKNRDFWMSLSAAEDQHAKFLREIGGRPEDAQAFVSRRRMRADVLKRAVADMAKKLQDLESTSVTQVWALTVAQEIENSMSEVSVLRPAPGDPDAVVAKIRQVNQDTHSHCVQIETALAELKREGGKPA